MRELVVAEARTWLGTKFLHQGRIKGAGVDCVGLMVGIAQRFGWQYQDVPAYGRQPNFAVMREALEKNLVPISMKEARPADILWFAFGEKATHLGLITDRGLIHATALYRCVVEHRLDVVWERRARAAFRFRELA